MRDRDHRMILTEQQQQQEPTRPRRIRAETNRCFFGTNPNVKSLNLEQVLQLIKHFEEKAEFQGGMNCSMCGKLYKSKVCFTKHVWEHSVYWDMFEDDMKNHDRVLSIQAALILYTGVRHNNYDEYSSLTAMVPFVLVTSPNEKPRKDVGNANDAIHQIRSPTKFKHKSPSPLRTTSSKRKRSTSRDSEPATERSN